MVEFAMVWDLCCEDFGDTRLGKLAAEIGAAAGCIDLAVPTDEQIERLAKAAGDAASEAANISFPGSIGDMLHYLEGQIKTIAKDLTLADTDVREAELAVDEKRTEAYVDEELDQPKAKLAQNQEIIEAKEEWKAGTLSYRDEQAEKLQFYCQAFVLSLQAIDMNYAPTS